MNQSTYDKLHILADAAKYDVSCATSGVTRNKSGKIGNATASGICHSWSADGRCISLLKVLLTNDCVYDCAYCANRISNDVKRASFTPEEVADLTIEFYRRNYIEGLFLSSAIEVNPNHTMEKLVKTLSILRNDYGFGGYIHVKAIPSADPLLITKAGELADRMSVNIELPSETSLKLLAPQKPIKKLMEPMMQIKRGIDQAITDGRRYKSTPTFVPGGQSTQMIIGATPDTDLSIIKTSENLYNTFGLKRVYYSAYVPVNTGTNLPSIQTTPPMVRENRLYQADWLLRFYEFNADELLDSGNQNFDLEIDPKLMWALRHPEYFPIEINRASYRELLRIPGLGVISAKRIIKQRSLSSIQYKDLAKMGVVLKRAKYFITCNGYYEGLKEIDPTLIKAAILPPKPMYEQLSFFNEVQ